MPKTKLARIYCWSCLEDRHDKCDRRRGLTHPDPRNPGKDKLLTCDCCGPER